MQSRAKATASLGRDLPGEDTLTLASSGSA